MNSNKQKITFLLPGTGHTPIGGFKIVYEYANRLSQLGYEVSIVHAASVGMHESLRKKCRSALKYIYWKLRGGPAPADWFQIDPSVKVLWTLSLAERYIPDGDFIIATWWATAEQVIHYSGQKGKPFYLIQHLETWSGPTDEVYATWKMPLQKIVISRWLKDIADRLAETSLYIPNGLDFEKFGLDVPLQSRNNSQCMMLYSALDWKGSFDGLKAFSIARENMPSLEVNIFGVSNAPNNLPGWCHYYRCPSQSLLRDLYNKTSVFVAPSWAEGWDLTATEAMMCGAALVATDIGGHREFCLHERTALLSRPKDPGQLATNIVRLINNSKFRIALATCGNAYIQQYTWERSVKQFQSALNMSKGRKIL